MNSKNFEDVKLMRVPGDDSGYVLKKLQKIIEQKYEVEFQNYWEFHQWSVDHLAEFWAEMWDFTGVIFSKKYEKVIDLNLPISCSPQWFEGARLNYAENLLKYKDDRVAMIIAGEERDTETVSFAEMFKEASLYAAAFRRFGLKKGDVVAAYMSNRKEAVFAMQATLSIGAIWTGALPLLGPQAVLNRFLQVKPKLFVTLDRFKNEGQEINLLKNVEVITKDLPSLEKVLIVPSTENSKLKDISGISNSFFLDDFLELGKNKDGTVPPMEFEQVLTTHPVFIHYTSGTTGIPKAIKHGAGALLAVARDFAVHSCSTCDSIWFSVSPVGWVSWTAVASLHFMGMASFLFEGVPYFLTPTYFWEMVDKYRITHLFLPASIVDEFDKKGYIPRGGNELSSLQVFMCGGSVVKPQSYDFIYGKVKKDAAFASSYGTTELMCSNIILDASLPVYRGEIPCISLGAAIEVVDESGQPVIGQVGELVIAKPMPNLPLGLWGDLNNEAFKKKYFSKYPGKFSLSDFAVINPVTKGLVICCRSDETLKQRGWRFGSSEIYNVMDRIPEVRDSLCVSQYSPSMDERAVLFLKIKDEHRFDNELVKRVVDTIAKELTAGHVPDVILPINDIPYNVTGKKMEVTVKKIINNMSYNSDSIRNPESLSYFFNIPQLQGFK